MGSKICMSEVCRTTTSSEWKKAWALKSGGFATLCHRCGSAYENLVFCETFHLEESGWRECRICGKRIHCGCIASKFLHEYLDFGGIGCVGCVKHLEAHTVRPIQVQIPGEIGNGTLASNGIGNVQPFDNNRLMQLSKVINGNEPVNLLQAQNHSADVAVRQLKEEPTVLPKVDASTYLPNINQHLNGSSSFKKPDKNRPKQWMKDLCETPVQPSLDISLGTNLGASSSSQSFSGSEGKEQNKGSPFQQGQRTHHILPKAPKPAPSTSFEANKGTPSVTRVARPPVEGRGRNQLLPRYWPRITDQELQKLSGDLNSTIIPLFEKVLSASDAGRIGRLVLPKACAEAYFPPINQSEGVPIRMQDIKGKEWTFQFRFWPNNNSRMYVLEGVTPCIQNMQLQAGDTVTFSRIDPSGKLVMGFRKATNNDAQDGQTKTVTNGGSTGEVTFSGVNENLAASGSRTSDDNVPRQKKTRNIGSKSKRLLIHSEDAMELRITWEEAQELLRPPPTARPTIVLIEGHEFEEYEEPPVFGKKTIFTARSSGEQEQWAQCDSCSKWRRLPAHVLLPAKWSCSDNIWDSSRCSCSVSEDINQKELDALLQVNKDFKRQRLTENSVVEESEPSGLDALATAAVLGDNMGDLGDTSVGATTKHPRHRPGCTCIVCIQPPSGKGKHPPSCTCNVCLTVRRRFKTLMLRKRKRQLERGAELAQGKVQDPSKNDSGTVIAAGQALLHVNHLENDRMQDENQIVVAETSKGQLDLNFHPNREDELLAVAAGMSMTNLVNANNLPLEMYLMRTGLGSLVPCLLSQTAGDGEQRIPEGCNTSSNVEMDNKDENGNTSKLIR